MAAKATSEGSGEEGADRPATKTSGPRAAERAAARPLRYCAAPPAPVLQLPPEVAANPSPEAGDYRVGE